MLTAISLNQYYNPATKNILLFSLEHLELICGRAFLKIVRIVSSICDISLNTNFAINSENGDVGFK